MHLHHAIVQIGPIQFIVKKWKEYGYSYRPKDLWKLRRSSKLQRQRLERLCSQQLAGVLHQSRLCGRAAKINPLLKNSSGLQFARRQVGDSEVSWKKFLQSDETSIELFGHQTKWLHCYTACTSQRDNEPNIKLKLHRNGEKKTTKLRSRSHVVQISIQLRLEKGCSLTTPMQTCRVLQRRMEYNSSKADRELSI